MPQLNVNVIASQLSCIPHDLLAERFEYALSVLLNDADEERNLKKEAYEYAERARENMDYDTVSMWDEDFGRHCACESALRYAVNVICDNILRADINFITQ